MLVPTSTIKHTFNQWHDRIYERHERRANRELDKKKDTWFEFTTNEVKNPQEFTPCLTRCYPSEPIDIGPVTVETPVVITTKDGNAKEAAFAKRFRLVFNMVAMDDTSINVTTWEDSGRLLVEAISIRKKVGHVDDNKKGKNKNGGKKSGNAGGGGYRYSDDDYDSDDDDEDLPIFPYIYFYGRKFRLPPDVDLGRMEASLTDDKQLILEAPILDDDELQRRKRLERLNSLIASKQNTLLVPEFNRSMKSRKMPSGTCSDYIQRISVPPNELPIVSEFNSPVSSSATDVTAVTSLDEKSNDPKTPDKGTGDPKTPDQPSPTASNDSLSGGTKEMKVGVPIFRDEDKVRRMYLTLFIGEDFESKNVIVQVLKENRVQITAKRKIKERWRSKTLKLSQCYDLSEKINPFTLKAGFTRDKKLVLTALAKDGLHHESSSDEQSSQSSDDDDEKDEEEDVN